MELHDSFKVGDYLDKKWIGGEIQIFADLLGGLAIKGEYIAGTNSTASAITVYSDKWQKRRQIRIN